MTPEGWVAVIASILGAGGLGSLATAWWRSRREKRADTIQEWKDLVAQLERQGERQEAVIRQMQTAIESLWQSGGQCRAALAERATSIQFLYDLLRRLHAELVQLGRNPGELPELPKMSELDPPKQVEFQARQAIQSAVLVQQASGVIKAGGGQ